MRIIKIEDFKKYKCKILTDEETDFVLYKTDLKRYGIAEGMEISETQKGLLFGEILPNRAKERSLKLLQGKDYTTEEIRRKLQSDGYPHVVVEMTISKLSEYHLLDDERYAKLYIQSRNARKSKKVIVIELQKKGIDKNIIFSVLDDIEYNAENNGDLYCIRNLLHKKKYSDVLSYEEKEKIKAYLFRKGFEIQDILYAMRNYDFEEVNK